MSENVETYRRAIDAFNRRDKHAWLSTTHPELENHPPRDWPEQEVIRGAAEVWDFYVESFEAFDEGGVEFVGAIEEREDALVAEVAAQVRGKASGAEAEWRFWQVLELRDGKAIRIAWFSDRGEALAAAGIDEPGTDEPS
jgi:ketosteroid isomerase-like protein